MLTRSCAPCLFALLALTGPAQAHDLWVERAGDRLTLYYGHGHSRHEGAARIDYPPEAVLAAACYDTGGHTLKAEIDATYPVTLTGDCAVSHFRLSSGYWSKTPYGTRNLSKDQGGGAVIDSWLSFESVKRFDRFGQALARPLSNGLELVPLGDPLRLRVGDKLRVAVYRDGLPVANATVAYFGDPRGVTGADGVVAVRLRSPGLQSIETSVSHPSTDPGADRVIEAAALQFEVSK